MSHIETTIREFKFSRSEVWEFIEEFERLLIFLHKDNSTGELIKLVKFFDEPIATSMPLLCSLESMFKELFDEADRVVIILE